MDTVPPFFPSSEDGDCLRGRGACDTKGGIASMVKAAEELLARGNRGFGLLFVVGEETVSAGATVADRGDSGTEEIICAMQKNRNVREAVGVRGFVHLAINHVCSGSYFHDSDEE
jgi:acetylornithine deacetylase